MSTISDSLFSAADSMLGYLYQVRIALLWSLRKLKFESDFMVSLETLDDVVFELKDGTPKELLQSKHHCQRAAALTNASPDLWGTLLIWFDAYEKGLVNPGTALFLLTTTQAGAASIASYLKTETRNVEEALNLALTTAQTSQSKDNHKAYKAFLDALPARRREIFENIVILDGSVSVTELDQQLTAEVFYAAERKDLASFLPRLEGWWYTRAIQQLTRAGDRILSDEIEAEMSDLREQFKLDNLPVDPDISCLDLIDLDPQTRADLNSFMFVRQLDLCQANSRRVAAAIRDYYRAFEQRSKWVRDQLVGVGEIGRYEKKLAEEWELVFEGMRDELGDDLTDELKAKAAREVLRWVESCTMLIRPRVTDKFITRGSLHMLSDELKVGWHPEFLDRLRTVLPDKVEA